MQSLTRESNKCTRIGFRLAKLTNNNNNDCHKSNFNLNYTKVSPWKFSLTILYFFFASKSKCIEMKKHLFTA